MTSKLSKFEWQNSSNKRQLGLFNWKINNFRSIGAGEKSQSLELAPLTIICGENSSGKSTILNSILFITQMFSDSDDETHINQQGSLINLGEFMEIVNETDAGVLNDDSNNESDGQHPSRDWLKNESDSFLQFSGSISIPNKEWQDNNLNEFSPSQIHFEIGLNSLLEDSYDFEQLKKLNDEYGYYGQKSKDKSRLLKFNADFVSYFTHDSGYFSYYDLPKQIKIPEEDDILEEGICSLDRLSVVNQLVDFSKSKINYSNFENLKIERELKNKKYLFVDSEAERLFSLSSPEYEIKIGKVTNSIFENNQNFGLEEFEKSLNSGLFGREHGSCVPVLKNGLPKHPKIRTIDLNTHLGGVAKTVLEMIQKAPSLNEILNNSVGVTVSNDSYAPDTFWEDVLSYNAEVVFDVFLNGNIPEFQKQATKITKQDLKNVHYWKWNSKPNEVIHFDRSGDQLGYSYLAIEKLVNDYGQPLSITEITNVFIDFLFEHMFKITKSIDGDEYFKFRATRDVDFPDVLFDLGDGLQSNREYETTDFKNNESKKVQAYFKDLLEFVNDPTGFLSALEFLIPEFAMKHGLSPDELEKIYNSLGKNADSQLSNKLSAFFTGRLAGLLKTLSIFEENPLIISTAYEESESESVDTTDQMRAAMMAQMAKSFEKIKYIGPLRQLSIKEERNINFHKNAPLGVNGEQFFNYFEKTKRNSVKVPFPVFDKNKTKFVYESTTVKVAMDSWLRYFDIAQEFDTETIVNLNILKGYVIPTDLNRKLRLDNLGVGFSQLAPIILLCITSEPGDTILLEQPELHLHPAVQQKFANFALEFSKKETQIILETHSDHLVNRLRRELVESKESLRDMISIFFVERKKGLSKFTLANVDKFGQYEFGKYPEGFFDQTAEDSLAILKARAKLKQDE